MIEELELITSSGPITAELGSITQAGLVWFCAPFHHDVEQHKPTVYNNNNKKNSRCHCGTGGALWSHVRSF